MPPHDIISILHFMFSFDVDFTYQRLSCIFCDELIYLLKMYLTPNEMIQKTDKPGEHSSIAKVHNYCLIGFVVTKNVKESPGREGTSP